MSPRLRNFKLPKLSGITANSASFDFAELDFNLLFITRQEMLGTITERESLEYFRLERASYSSFS
jgi:hypothetical protein